MDYTHLTIDFPRLTGEQAAKLQQTLYAFLDAFDSHYCFAIEDYHQDLSNQEQANNVSLSNLVHELFKSNDPF